MGDGEFTMTVAVPPVQFNHVVKAKVGNQVENMMRHQNGRRHSAPPFGLPHDGPQRWPVQVVEVGMSHQHQVNGRQIADFQARLPQTLEDEEPACKVGVDDNILAAHLEKKTRMTDESHAHFAAGRQLGLMAMPGPGSDRGASHQAAELPGAVAQRTILAGCSLTSGLGPSLEALKPAASSTHAFFGDDAKREDPRPF